MKKVLCLLCALLLALSCLTACGPAENPATTPNNNDPTNAPTSGAAPAMDLKGRIIRIMHPSNWTVPDLTDEKNSFAQTMKRFNCKFEFIEFTDEIAAYNNLVMSYLSGKTDYDALIMRGYNVVPGYAASGVLLNMSNYFDFNADGTWMDPLVSEVGVWRGDRYGLPLGPQETGYAIWYNRQYLREANLPDLWEYVEEGTWNFDTFRQVLKKLTKVENGKTTRYAFYCEDPMSSFIMANGGTFIDISGESAKLCIDSDESLAAMQYVVDLQNVDGSIPSAAELEKLGNPSVLDMFMNGTVAMTAYGVWAGPLFQNNGIDPEDLGWIYFPKGENAEDYVVPGATPRENMVIHALAEKPEEVVAALADALGYWGESKEFPRDIESAYEEVLEHDQMLDILVGNNQVCYLEGAAKTKYSYLYNYEGIIDVYGEMVTKILDNELTPKAAVDSYFSKIQSKIDKIENGIDLDDYQ
jgi:multiple sugar transport system substrate-binding protein